MKEGRGGREEGREEDGGEGKEELYDGTARGPGTMAVRIGVRPAIVSHIRVVSKVSQGLP